MPMHLVKEDPVSSRFRRAAALAFAIALAASGCAGGEELAPSISPEALQARIASGDAPLLLDVRTPAEFQDGHIPGAINVPHEQVASRAAELASQNGVAVYCMKGPRARLGEQALLAAGATEVLHVEGGFSAWQAAGLPVEQ
jgi:rhodanese-related sulfurtransferase